MAPFPHHNVLCISKHSLLPRSKEVASSSHCLNYFIIAAALADVAIALIAAIGINLSATHGKSRPSAGEGGEGGHHGGQAAEGQLHVEVSLFKCKFKKVAKSFVRSLYIKGTRPIVEG